MRTSLLLLCNGIRVRANTLTMRGVLGLALAVMLLASVPLSLVRAASGDLDASFGVGGRHGIPVGIDLDDAVRRFTVVQARIARHEAPFRKPTCG